MLLQWLLWWSAGTGTVTPPPVATPLRVADNSRRRFTVLDASRVRLTAIDNSRETDAL